MPHTFHIPVLGLGFSIDTPLKVARYGISSTVSIVDDELAERMRKYHSEQNNIEYTPIHKWAFNSRARRITAYLNLLNLLVDRQFTALRAQPFDQGNDIVRYFNLLPDHDVLKQGYELLDEYEDGVRKNILKSLLRSQMIKGAIDVNIMAKVDKPNYDKDGYFTGDLNSDALAALRGFAESNLESSVVISAGMNPGLFNYIGAFKDFYPDEKGYMRKKVILKVSNYRSANIQARLLAKKGIWVSEFRIESGLNCGGHAFATDGLLMGPILEEFTAKREDMRSELFEVYQQALEQKGMAIKEIPRQRISVQGGIGTADEHNLLTMYYRIDGTGWGSPFLLVPETTNVDNNTLLNLANSTGDDFYLSNVSPLGVLFNNYKKNTIEQQRVDRIVKGRPGSPCPKKYLCSNTEFTDQPICTASRQYQQLKIQQLKTLQLSSEEYQQQYMAITEKICLCEGLCTSVYIKNGMIKPRESTAVAICPGPNLAYFSQIYSLDEMVDHIYGRVDVLKGIERPNFFINELNLYIDYLKNQLLQYKDTLNEKTYKYFYGFINQLKHGISYYRQLFPQIFQCSANCLEVILRDLSVSEKNLEAIQLGKQLTPLTTD